MSHYGELILLLNCLYHSTWMNIIIAQKLPYRASEPCIMSWIRLWLLSCLLILSLEILVGFLKSETAYIFVKHVHCCSNILKIGDLADFVCPCC